MAERSLTSSQQAGRARDGAPLVPFTRVRLQAVCGAGGKGLEGGSALHKRQAGTSCDGRSAKLISPIAAQSRDWCEVVLPHSGQECAAKQIP